MKLAIELAAELIMELVYLNMSRYLIIIKCIY